VKTTHQYGAGADRTSEMNGFFDSLKVSDVSFRVLNLESVASFYRDVVGLRETGRDRTTVRFSASGQEPAQIVLIGDPGAHPRSLNSPGLFHTALLLPSRKELAGTVRHIGERGWRFQGFADHGVSEAAYLTDPEGNGLELYRDRPKEEWPGGESGVAMVTEPLDVPGLIAEAPDPESPYRNIHPRTVIGHIHLQVSSLENGQTFYHDLLGLDVTQRDYPGALFLSANGYHHHVGLNVWNSRGAHPSPSGSSGLVSFGIAVGRSHVEEILARADQKHMSVHKSHLGFRIMDPDEIPLELSIL